MAETLKKEADYPEVKASPYWIRKMRTVFRRLDYTGTGVVYLDDLLEVCTNLMTNFPKMDTFKGDDVVNAMVDTWFTAFCTHLDQSNRTSSFVTENDFVENMKKAINTEFKSNFLVNMVVPFFRAADNDDDGKISALEFKTLMKSWKAVEKDSDVIFRTMDTGRTGRLTQEQFHAAMAEHFYCEEPKCSQRTEKMWGELVSYKRPEDFGEIQCGPFWEGKMRTMFRRMDVTGKGKLKCKDFIQIARGIIYRGRLDRKKADAVTRSMITIWVKYMGVSPEGELKQKMRI